MAGRFIPKTSPSHIAAVSLIGVSTLLAQELKMVFDPLEPLKRDAERIRKALGYKGVPHNLEVLVPGDMTEEERERRWFAYMDARTKAVKEYEEAKGRARRDALKYAWDEATYKKAIAEAQRTFHEEAEVKAKEVLRGRP